MLCTSPSRPDDVAGADFMPMAGFKRLTAATHGCLPWCADALSKGSGSGFGDSLVLFRGSDVISTGDIFTPDGYPFIDLERGGSVEGEIAALNHILQLTVPAKTQEGGTYVIPGHGRICDDADVVEFRDMVVIVRDRVRDLIQKGRTLDEVKATRPTRDYDTEYVSSNSFVTADRFVEAVYKSLSR